ncbi:MAG: HAD family hydrolase [Sneathiella sp.]|nr:HAD family hydrolase [Sneathiella sp.]
MSRTGAKNLVVFDIDGTLMHSAGYDESMFKKAHAQHVGSELTDANWGNFTHMTDHAINTEFFERIHGRPASSAEVNDIKSTFFGYIKAAHKDAPEKFSPVKGSINAVNQLLETDGWSICFASGGWGVSSSFKLSTLGIDANQHPSAFGDTHRDRLSLVKSAITAAADAEKIDAFDKIVSIGDAIWDVETAKILNLAFIGVSTWVTPSALRAAGASHVIDHYEDYGQFSEFLDLAKVPV